MNNFKFIPISEKSLPIVLEIYNYYVANSIVTFRIKELSLEKFKNIIYINHKKYISSIIVDLGDNLCGFCLLTPYSEKEVYVRTAEVTIYLKPGYIGRGIGKAALDFLEENAKKNDIKVLLAVIAENNISSINLFKNNKYSKCAHYKNVGELNNILYDVIAYQKFL